MTRLVTGHHVAPGPATLALLDQCFNNVGTCQPFRRAVLRVWDKSAGSICIANPCRPADMAELNAVMAKTHQEIS
jgi:hypothetical protein